MGNNKKPACWIGLHSSDVFKELELTSPTNTVIGLVIVNRCNHCGVIKHTKIRTVEYN